MSTQENPIYFGEWLPDRSETNNPGCVEAENTIAIADGFTSLPDLDPFTNALDNPCVGSFWIPDSNDNIFNFAGDAGKLYSLVGGNAWTDVSKLATTYNAGTWEFTKFGSRVLATNGSEVIQKFDVDIPDANFTDLANAPIAKRIATVRDFVVVGDLVNFGPNVVGWSGFNSSDTWNLANGSLRTQSDKQELFGRGGKIQRIVPGEIGYIFQEQSIWRMEYVGPPLVFQFDEIERSRGTPAPYSVVWTGSTMFYYGWDNFYVKNGDQPSKPISDNRVSRWFSRVADKNALSSMRGAIDRSNRIIAWAFRSSQTLPYNDYLLIFNWVANRWSYARVNTQVIDEFVSPGFSLDALDAVLPGGIDSDSILVDSDAFTGGSLNILGFDETNTAGTFSGLPLTATITTRELNGGMKRIYTNALRPEILSSNAGTSIQTQIGHRNVLTENVVYTPALADNGINGEHNSRANSRYQRYRTIISGGFDFANGVTAHQKLSGGRR